MAVLGDEERAFAESNRLWKKTRPGLREDAERIEDFVRRGRCRRIKRRMLRCRQIDINRSSLSLSRARGQRVTMRHVVGTPRMVRSANTLSELSAVTLMVDSLDLGFGNQEPPCKLCTGLSSPYAINSRTSKNLYKLPVRRRRECCETTRSNAKVGTDLRSEYDSRIYNDDPVVKKIQDSRRIVQDIDVSKRCDKRKIQQEDVLEPSANDRITDLRNVRETVDKCLWEMRKIKTFLESENSWWELLKARPTDCCQQKLPHLHGVLDGSSVTLILLEEGIEQLPHHFVILKSQKRNDVTDSHFRTSSRVMERSTDPWKDTEEYSDVYLVPHYSLDVKSTLIKIASTDGHESNERHAKRVASKQSIASEFWTEGQESRSNPNRSKETSDKMQFQDKKKGTDRSNIMPPREIRYGQNTQTTFDDRLQPRETFSSEKTGNRKAATADFESNVNLNGEISSKNMANQKTTSHDKPKTKTLIEKGFNQIQKLPTKISRTKSRD